ncbi:hypothetical protein B0T10DRAFT_403866 [Thelonectria olida]|uniref:Uncharacterized protein n=1 Tax=Thelonectria olida TaxID=1576542 RepID=A0A9P8W5Q3_9HYPO|nr:hypothetical protein B0T10DRAFT_403866 [Thelonectria olida]
MNITVKPRTTFVPVYNQGEPGKGIGGYDLKSPRDRVFALDYDSSGKQDHLVLYRPGTGTCWILKNKDGGFAAVYAKGDPGNGIGGYDLKSDRDVGFAFDYNSSGKLDHLVWYRPGTGTCWILRKGSDGKWTPVYAQGDPGTGIGGYDLKSPNDRMFAFDYNSSGKMDHLALYRPGTGTFWILQKQGDSSFKAVFAQGDPGKGIGGYDLKSSADRAFAFDWSSSGKLDHIALYRPARGTFWVLQNNKGTFSAVMSVGDPGNGIGGYDLKSPADAAFAYDWDHSGKMDHVALYRPGTGTFWVVKRNKSSGEWNAVYNEGDPGAGVGGYDLKSPQDKMLAFDYESSGKSDYVVSYRTNGSGTIWILKRKQ